ncbi:cytoplasmic protein [Stereum hirsutum FP-91666 SS1]|uniref:cytoplasmic protein n=1 Tax=Stereum hirsutum (strain FP-91666) TaxID=721885 RepID=UPI000440FFE5|nr:cytoplasmic protein [Stereum hirsutum FP-91666 SS1]EIM87043.1 cytoplasmic protein [Stereum hirsutum FP-91666 SS1]
MVPGVESSQFMSPGEQDARKGSASSSPEESHQNIKFGPHPSINKDYTVGSSPSYAHDWSSAGIGGKIRTHGRHFVDAYGRVCSLRGVNLSGSSKTPANGDHSTFPAGHESVTFVGRPFPLEEAPEHLARLRRWGLTLVRFLVTWEAVEHDGPGIYDTSYVTYLRSILSLLPSYGLTAFVSMHQDVWSRYSGGSGAPAWTLEMVGFDLHALEESGAAWLLGVKGGGHVEAERGIWPCGYQKLAAATMATCFWAGDVFAPKLKIKTRDGSEVPVQQFLQNAFLGAWEVVARTVGDLEGVIGFELMNEPHRGYIDLPSLHGFDYNTDLHLSHVPSALQSFLLGSGYPTTVPHYTRSFPLPTRLTSQSVLNSSSRKAWRPDGPTSGKDIWEMHGVWGYDTNKKEGVVLRENYFVKNPETGKKVEWYEDFYYPFLQRWTQRVRGVGRGCEEKMVFLEPIPNEFCPASWTPEHQPENMVYAPHWYCLNTLFNKAYGDFSVNVQGLSRGMFPLKAFYWGHRGARENFKLQIRNIVEKGYEALGEKPVVIGECGIPMDMNKGEAFRTDDWKWQNRMMDAMITGLEQALVGFTLWNYNPFNDDAAGDDWNGENFSWFSRSRALPVSESDPSSLKQTSKALDAGGRILQSIVRPYPAKTAGIPLKFEYEMTTGKFVYEWAIPGSPAKEENSSLPLVNRPPLAPTSNPILTSRETLIFVPSSLTAGRQLVVTGLSSSDTYRYDIERQTLFVLVGENVPGMRHKIEVQVQGEGEQKLEVFKINGFWEDWSWAIVSLLVVLVGILVMLLRG